MWPPRSNKSVIKGTFWGLSFLGLVIFHALTLTAPVAEDAVGVDYSVHGTMTLWNQILPKHHDNTVDLFITGFWNGFHWVQRQSIRYLGIGLWQARAAPVMAALFGLGLLLWFLRRSGVHWSAWLGVFLFGFSNWFFKSVHFARPEPFVFLAMVANFMWLWLQGGRISGTLCGFYAGIMWSFHPAIVFFCAAFPLLVFFTDGIQSIKQPRYAWWGVGFLSGIIAALYVVNVEDGMRWIHATQLFGHDQIEVPPLIYWKWDLLSILEHSLVLLVYYVEGSRLHPIFLACVFTANAWQLRRFRHLDRNEQFFLLIGLFMFAAYSFLSAAPDPCYILYVIGWLLIQFTLVIHKLWAGSMRLDRHDSLLLVCANFTIMTIAFSPSLFFAMCLCVGMMGISWRGRGWFDWAVMVYIIALQISSPNLFGRFFRVLGWQWGAHPFIFPLIVLFLLIVIVVCRKGIVFTGREKTYLRAFYGAYFFVMLFSHCVMEWNIQREWIVQSRLSPEVEHYLCSIRQETRVVGPQQLWLYEPGMALQAVEALTPYNEYHAIRFNVLARLIEYHPTLILWPEAHVPSLLRQSGSRKNLASIELGQLWAMPFGRFREVRLRPHSKMRPRI